MNLADYIMTHTNRGECSCGKCFDRGEKPDPTGHVADVAFFKVGAVGRPTKDELLKLVKEHKGEFNDVDPFDGKEHSYIELGGWLGSQQVALCFIGLAALVGAGKLLTPRTVLGADLPEDLVKSLAGQGLVAIQA